MSPPCVGVVFEGDNGGATARGVTGQEIAVAVPAPSTTAGAREVTEALFEHFNQRYEFYGRRLRPVFIETYATNDPATARATGAEIGAQQVFGTVTTSAEWLSSPQPALFQELARQQVVSVALGDGWLLGDRELFDELHPYLWSVYPSAEQLWTNVADFSCASLAGRPARHAGASLQSTKRKFGILTIGYHTVPPTRRLVEGLAACGEQAEVVQWASSSTPSTQLTLVLRALKDRGVTTVICACMGSYFGSAIPAATRLSFQPEWMLPTYSAGSGEVEVQHLQPGERASIFGLTPRARFLPVQQKPWFQAVASTRPELVASLDSAAIWNVLAFGRRAYDQLLLLAAGIQGAGPQLTPDAFGAALMQMQFPNTGAGQAPYWQPSAGFGPGDHSMISDYALQTWSDQLEPLDPISQPGQGSWCYLDRGARFRSGGYPVDADSRMGDPAEPCR